MRIPPGKSKSLRKRDLQILGMFRSLGIEKDKEFKPDAAMQTILKQSSNEAL
jgi:hypothetical protein